MNILSGLAWLEKVPALLPWIALAIALGALAGALIVLALRYRSFRYLLGRDVVFLELTPPASVARTPDATKQLFSVIHGQQAARSLKDKWLGRNVVVAFEIPSTYETGVRYVVSAERQLVTGVRQAITSYLPDVKVAEVADFMPRLTGSCRVIEFKQTGHYAFPLASQESLEQHDLIAYLIGVMTKLKTGEFMSIQIILTPVHLREARVLSHKILGNEDLLAHLSSRRGAVWPWIANAISTLLFGVIDGVSATYNTPTKQSYGMAQKDAHDRLQVAKRLKPARTLSSFEQQLLQSMHQKVSQPLFRVSIRAIVATDDKQETRERISAIKSALAVYSVSSYQALEPKLTFPWARKYRRFVWEHRLPSYLTRNDCVLSASEVAGLYHFPLGNTSKTDNLVTSPSRTLAAPLSLKQGSELDVVLGQNYHHGTETAIGLTAAERERHMYIIGGTGNGKTTMLQYAIVQDINNGKGVAVIDPHGDLAKTLLNYIPEDRIKDVVYLNPADLKHPIGINLLELPPEDDEDEREMQKSRVTEAVISILRKIFSDDDSNAHRIESMLRNTILTAMTVEGATLFTVLKLLRNKQYCKIVVAKLKDEDLKDFWREEMNLAGDMQRVSMTKGVTNRIDRFRSSPPAKRMLEQPKSTINFEEIIDSGKILICNFAQGDIGEDTSALFGTMVLAELKLAAERRTRMSEKERRPFYVYVDEFQNFATTPFLKMLSSSRKFKLFLTIAEQSTSQQDEPRMTEQILSNVSTVITFRTGSAVDERLLLPRFAPHIELGEIGNLPAYHFYARIQALQSLEPVSGITIRLPEIEGHTIADKVIDSSQKLYGVVAMSDETTSEAELNKDDKAPLVTRKKLAKAI